MYKKKNYSAILSLTIFLLCSCEERQKVLVEDNRNKTYSYQAEEEGVERLPFPKMVRLEESGSYTKIAAIYNIPHSKLLEHNKEINDRPLNAGEIIYLPQTLYHQVLHGENLEVICRKYRQYKVTPEEIRDLNQLKNDELTYGEIIKVFSLEEPEIKYTELNSEEKIEVEDIAVEEKTEEKVEEKLENTDDKKQELLVPQNISDTPKFAWPLKGNIIENKLSNELADKNQSYGITIETAFSSPVRSVADGEVIHVGVTKDYGNMVIIKHEDNILSAYGYLEEITVAKSAQIKQGMEIGKSGKRLSDEKPSLYLVTRKKSVMVDPLTLLPKE